MTMKITSASFHACAVGKEGLPKDELPIIALVGRSNVGKSSLINTLTGRRELARTSSLPGKTLTINFYLFNELFYLVDLPGYGYAKASKATKKAIQEMMNEFFGECDRLKGIIQVLDIRHEPSKLDVNMFTWIKEQKYNYLSVLTKTDKLSNQQVIKMRKKILRSLNIDFSLLFSSKNASGRNELLDALEKIVSGLVVVNAKPAPRQVKKARASKRRLENETGTGKSDSKKSDGRGRNDSARGDQDNTGSSRRRRRRPKNNAINKPSNSGPKKPQDGKSSGSGPRRQHDGKSNNSSARKSQDGRPSNRPKRSQESKPNTK